MGSRPRCWRTAITGEIAVGKSSFDRGMTRAIFKSALSLQTATVRAGLVLVCIDLVGRALLRRPDIWAARQRSPTNVENVVKSAQAAAVLVLVY
jgi:hypothetical protein